MCSDQKQHEVPIDPNFAPPKFETLSLIYLIEGKFQMATVRQQKSSNPDIIYVVNESLLRSTAEELQTSLSVTILVICALALYI